MQELVDALADRLDRHVLVDDSQLALIAYSAQRGQIDEVRVSAILRRAASAEVRQALLAQGIASATEPMRTRAEAALKMDSRLCVPIRSNGQPLAYLWILDSESTLAPSAIEAAAATAERIGGLLVRERRFHAFLSAREQDLVRQLLTGETHLAAGAARELHELELLPLGRPVAAVLVRVVLDNESAAVAPLADAAPQLAAVRRHAPNERLAGAAVCGDLLLLVANDEPRRLAEFAQALPSIVRQFESERVVVGYGEPSPLPQATGSRRQAAYALELALRLPSLGNVVGWRDLGVYRLLETFRRGGPTREALHPALAELERTRGGAVLVETLSVYLERGGSVQAAARQLAIDRTTLYGRLRRIEQITGVDLSSGEDRLALHLSLRLRALAVDEESGR